MGNSPNPRILYVDDDQDTCEVIGLMLHLEVPGYPVSTVSTAQNALDVIENEPIALFILDYAVPEMSGIELCRIIRRTDSQIPIMFYSGMAREIDREEAQAAGATEYLVKPNDLDKFTETVRRLLAENTSIFRNESSIKTETSKSNC